MNAETQSAHHRITNPHRLGEAIRARRKERGMTQVQVAEAAGISVFCLRDLERAQRSVGTDAVFRVLSTLNCVMSLTGHDGWGLDGWSDEPATESPSATTQ